eukprot:6358782-Prymnesium_polylepis.3
MTVVCELCGACLPQPGGSSHGVLEPLGQARAACRARFAAQAMDYMVLGGSYRVGSEHRSFVRFQLKTCTQK